MLSPSLRRLHAFFLSVGFYPLALCTLLAGLMLVGRMHHHASPRYAFLLWNLFLAWVPYISAVALMLLVGARAGAWLVTLAGGLWLIFLPNALYIITDFQHLLNTPTKAWWLDVAMLAAFAWTGCFLGIVSLQIVHNLVARRAGLAWGWTFVVGVAMLCGVGVYVGRFLRWNSWDVLTNPHEIIRSFTSLIADPLGHRRALAMGGLFTALMLMAYTTFAASRRIGYRDDASGN